MIRIMAFNGSKPTVQLFVEVEASMERMELDRQELLKVMQEGTLGKLGITGLFPWWNYFWSETHTDLWAGSFIKICLKMEFLL